jgi:hypothetical protein
MAWGGDRPWSHVWREIAARHLGSSCGPPGATECELVRGFWDARGTEGTGGGTGLFFEVMSVTRHCWIFFFFVCL